MKPTELLLKIIEEQAKHGERLARVEENLSEHMRRTAVAETKLEWMEKRVWIVYGIALAGSALASFIAKVFF